MNTNKNLLEFLQRRTHARVHDNGDRLCIEAAPRSVANLATALIDRCNCEFASLVPEEMGDRMRVRYFFYTRDSATLIEIVTSAEKDTPLPAISDRVHAADWYEREAEDLFGIRFAGHPFLGDFALHDDVWPEDVVPMRHAFDVGRRVEHPGLGANWQPRRTLREEGSIAFPVGPIWSGFAESGLWVLETPGEQIHAGHTRLFYKYRAVEKIAEGRSPSEALLVAERFSGNSAFAHAWAFCQALEKIANCEIPPYAQALRVVFAEFERLRHHVATIAELADSTALAVGKAMAQEIEERLLRLAGEVCDHRYLFGLCVPGGLAWAPGEAAMEHLRTGVESALAELEDLERTLVHTSSFLDRIEEMGTLRPDVADLYGVVGPVGRASGRGVDLRRMLPYGIYPDLKLMVPCEQEGDGYARLRVYFAEIRASAGLVDSVLETLPTGPAATACAFGPGAALAWVEAPAGGAFHWLSLDDTGRILRWRIAPPSFRNWHAFDRSFDGAAFQDFHIIMASFGLSVSESDR